MTPIELSRLFSFGLLVLIWLVQAIIYPAFAQVAPERFVAWHAGYTRAVTWIVAPLMVGQLGALAWLLVERPSPWAALAALMAAVAWGATYALAIPVHGRLQQEGPDRGLVARLIAENWIRTFAWSLAFGFLLLA